MPDRTPPDKRKLLMIAVLALVLVAVVYFQATAPDDNADVSPASTAVSPAEAALPPGGSPVLPRRRPNHVPVPLETTLTHNPFAYPEALKTVESSSAGAAIGSGALQVFQFPALHAVADVESAPDPDSPADLESAQRQSLLEQWRAAEMKAYYFSGGQPVALVGTEVLHEGKILNECVRVVEIRSDAVVYDAYDPASGDPIPQ